MNEIPLVDLRPQYDLVSSDINKALADLFLSGDFILGSAVSDFESAFAKAAGSQYCVGVANGTDALELILRGLGIGAGDEVILPANTFVATALAVVRAGATPVLVDCSPQDLLIDLEHTARAITDRTKAVIAVHLYGQMAPIDELVALCDLNGIHLVEDACQAHGATQGGKHPGAQAAAAAYSFYPGKNLGGFGDGGAVATNSDDLARRIRALRNYGSEEKYVHDSLGFNSRLDSVQAVVLLSKLVHLPAWNEDRAAIAAQYTRELADVKVTLPSTAPGNVNVWHLYVARVSERQHVFTQLRDRGIGVGIHYPRPIHLQPAFNFLGKGKGSFPAAEAAANEVLSLPLYPGMPREHVTRVTQAVFDACGRK